MMVYMTISFMAGGLFGMLGMAVLAYGSKMQLVRENKIFKARLDFLEKETPKRHFQPVEDPRTRVHALVS
jgi:hypothetical protein